MKPVRSRAVLHAGTALVAAALLACSTGTPAHAGTTSGERAGHHAAPPTDRVRIGDRYVYLNGVNVPWGSVNTYGTDIACTYDPQHFEEMFDNLQAYGANAVRLWLHVDGRCSPSFDPAGDVTGVPAHFWTDLDDFLTRARRHNIAVLLTLWAPEMVNIDPAWESVRPDRTSLITDPAKTRSYIDHVLVPMAERYRHEPALLGYEVINEPEFAVDSPDVWGAGNHGPDYRATVPLATMQRFVAQQVVALHRHTRQNVVAAGSAAYKWLASTGIDATVGNWWSDDALKAQVPADQRRYAYSDFYEVHWYDWEKGSGYSFSPWDGRGPGAYNTDGKPVVIGELPAAGDRYYTNDAMLKDSYDLGYAGTLFWSYEGIDGFGDWADVRDRIKAFRDAHPGEVDLDLAGHHEAAGAVPQTRGCPTDRAVPPQPSDC